MPEARERIVLLTDGADSVLAAKTACSLLRYRPDDVIAVLDRSRAGQSAGQAFGVGDATPIIESLAEAPEATTLAVGIAPPGGRVPAAWRPILLEALQKRLKVISGLHDFIGNDPEFAAARRGALQALDLRSSTSARTPSGTSRRAPN